MFLFFSRASRANFAATPLLRPDRENRHATQATFAPKSSLADEITEIRITHLKQLQSITLEAKLFSDKGELFESYAHYVADKDGNVDVGHDLSVGGSYCGVEPMGL